jgi:hypothetical protein
LGFLRGSGKSDALENLRFRGGLGLMRGFSNWRVGMGVFEGPAPEFVKRLPEIVRAIWLETVGCLPAALRRADLPAPVDIRREGYRSSRAFGMWDTFRGRGHLVSIDCRWAGGEELVAEFDIFDRSIVLLTSKLGDVRLVEAAMPPDNDSYGAEFLAREAVKLLGGDWVEFAEPEPIAERDENGLPVWWGGKRPSEYTREEFRERWEDGLPWDPEEYPSRVCHW